MSLTVRTESSAGLTVFVVGSLSAMVVINAEDLDALNVLGARIVDGRTGQTRLQGSCRYRNGWRSFSV